MEVSRRSFLVLNAAAGLGLSAFPILNKAQNKKASVNRLNLTEPNAKTIANLQKLIPDLMEHQLVPGISVAVVRNAKIVWSEAFGVGNVEAKE